MKWIKPPAFMYDHTDWSSVSGVDFSSLGAQEQDAGDSPNESQVNAATTELTATAGATDSTPADKLIYHYSSLNRLCRAVLWFKKFVNWRRNKNVLVTDIDADQMHAAKMGLIRYVQKTVYRVEYALLSTGKDIPKKDKLYHLEPSLDDNGIVRIGGRLRHADVSASTKQVLMPRDHHVTTLIVRHVHHVLCLHSGTEHVLSML